MSSSNAVVTREQLCEKIKQLPQVDIGHFPTPLEECPRLSEALGGPRILIKREDCSGLAFGGNKVRQLTFTIGDGVNKGADTIIQGAASQSNHCRQAAAASAKLGLKCYLRLSRDNKSMRQGMYYWTIWLARMLNLSMRLWELNSMRLNMPSPKN